MEVVWLAGSLDGGDGSSFPMRSNDRRRGSTIMQSARPLTALLPPENASDAVRVPVVRLGAGGEVALAGFDQEGRRIVEGAAAIGSDGRGSAEIALPAEIRNALVRFFDRRRGERRRGAAPRRQLAAQVGRPHRRRERRRLAAAAGTAHLCGAGARAHRRPAALRRGEHQRGGDRPDPSRRLHHRADRDRHAASRHDRGAAQVGRRRRHAAPLRQPQPRRHDRGLAASGAAAGRASARSAARSPGRSRSRSALFPATARSRISRCRRTCASTGRCSPTPMRCATRRSGPSCATARRSSPRAREGKGRIVLFHVTADPRWSNLPLSGAFVDMLNAIVDMAGTVQCRPTAHRAGGATRQRPRPGARSRCWTAMAISRRPDPGATLVADIEDAKRGPADAARPLRSRRHGLRAEHAWSPTACSRRSSPAAIGWQGQSVARSSRSPATPIWPWLLAAAAVLAILDGLAVLALSGRLSRRYAGAAALALAVALAAAARRPGPRAGRAT